jgi:hypothetical protein
MTPAFAAGATSQSDPSLLLAPGIGLGLGEASDREVRRAVPSTIAAARRKEGKRDEQADVPFSLDLTLGASSGTISSFLSMQR